MQGKVIVLLRTSSVARAPIYDHLRHTLGLILVVVHPRQPAEEFGNVFHYWLQHDTCDLETLRLALDRFLHAHHLVPDAIVSFDEYAVYQAAVLAQERHLICVPLPPAEVQRTSVKAEFRRFCQDVGIVSPAMALLPRMKDGAAEGLEAHVRQCMLQAGIAFPVVLKPSPGAGSFLTRRCDNLGEAVSHARIMWSAMDSSPETVKHFTALAAADPTGDRLGSSSSGGEKEMKDERGHGGYESRSGTMEILMEEFIDGHEVDVDCIVQHGQVKFFSISDNFEPLPPFFAEAGGLCPAAAVDIPAQLAIRDLLFRYVAIYSSGSDVRLTTPRQRRAKEEETTPAVATKRRKGQRGIHCGRGISSPRDRYDIDGNICHIATTTRTTMRDSEPFQQLSSSSSSSSLLSATGPTTELARDELLPSVPPLSSSSSSSLSLPTEAAVMNGVLHFEAKYDPHRRRAYIIEVNCRPGSAETDVMVRTVYRGFELGEGLVRCALGLPVDEQLRRHFPEAFAPSLCTSSSLCCSSPLLQTDISFSHTASPAAEETSRLGDRKGVAGCSAGLRSTAPSSFPLSHPSCSPPGDQGGDEIDVRMNAPLRQQQQQQDGRVENASPLVQCGCCPCSAYCECSCCCCCCGSSGGGGDGGGTGEVLSEATVTPPLRSGSCDCVKPARQRQLEERMAAAESRARIAATQGEAGQVTGVNPSVPSAGPWVPSPPSALQQYAAALGGPSVGAFLPRCYAASVNIYPTCDGVLRHVAVPVAAPMESAEHPTVGRGGEGGVTGSDAEEEEELRRHLVAFSVAARPGDRVGPPPRPFSLLAWMVAEATDSAATAIARIQSLTARFEQTIQPLEQDA